MNDPRNRYKIYQQMLDAMVNIVDSMKLTVEEDEEHIMDNLNDLRKAIRLVNRGLDNKIQNINEFRLTLRGREC